MNPVFVFIIAIVMPSGEMQISHTLVPKCPTQEEVSAIMKPKKESGEIAMWGGSCAPLVPPTEI